MTIHRNSTVVCSQLHTDTTLVSILLSKSQKVNNFTFPKCWNCSCSEILSPPSGRKSNYILTLTLSACSWRHRFLSTFIYLFTTVKPPWALASQSLLLDVKWLPKVATNSRCQKIVSCELQSDLSWDGRGSSLFENMTSIFLLQVTEDVHRLIADYYNFVCRGQVSVKGKGQMLTYFLEGRRQGSMASQGQQQPSNAEQRSSAFTHGSVCTRLSPAPTVTTYATIRTPCVSMTKPTTSTSTTRYLPSVPTVMVWQMTVKSYKMRVDVGREQQYGSSRESLWNSRVIYHSSTVCGRLIILVEACMDSGLESEAALDLWTLPPHSRSVCCLTRRGVVNRIQDALTKLLHVNTQNCVDNDNKLNEKIKTHRSTRLIV